MGESRRGEEMQLTQEHVRIINDIRKDGGMRPITPECAQILFDQLSGEAQGEIMGRVLNQEDTQ
jgi:hypothetical protein